MEGIRRAISILPVLGEPIVLMMWTKNPAA
jgi:hypothetical protein